MVPSKFSLDTNGDVEGNGKGNGNGNGNCVTKGNAMVKDSRIPPVDSWPVLLRRSLSGSHEAESPKRPVLTYRPKPVFGVDSSTSSSLSTSTSVTWSAPASTQSGFSSPLSSTCGKSYDSSPNRMTSSSSSKGSGPLAVGREGAGQHDNPSLSEDNKAGPPNKAGFCCESLSSNGAVGEQKELANLDAERVASWSKYLDSSGESHHDTADRKHTLDLSQLFLGHKFACGTYSRLYRGQYFDEEVAVKMVRVPPDDEEVGKMLERQYDQEVHALTSLHHVNIIKFFGAVKKPPVFLIVTEYLARGSLRGFLQKNQPNTLAMDMVLTLTLDVARAMEYMHSQGVLHLDLKSHNLVLADNYSVKVTDFGVSRTQSECGRMTYDAGTLRWMAPELMKNCHSASVKADVYSFGIILWEIVTGLTPYEEMTTVQAAFAVVDKRVRPQIPDNCPRPLKELMEDCWAVHPERRPNAWQIVQRLEQFQECIRCNKTYQSWHREKGHWIMPFFQKFKQTLFACRQLRLEE